jgi:hypothetical protein
MSIRSLFCILALVLVTGGQALTGTVIYFRIVGMLNSRGVTVDPLITPWGLISTLETYKGLAREMKWPTWPTAVFWSALSGMFITGIALFFLCFNQKR